MSSAWCRFCGGFAMADRMVCGSDACQSKDLVSELAPFGVDWGKTRVTIPPVGIVQAITVTTANPASPSLHAHAMAYDMNIRTIRKNQTLHIIIDA